MRLLKALNRKIQDMSQDQFNTIMYVIVGTILLASFIHIMPASIDRLLAHQVAHVHIQE